MGLSEDTVQLLAVVAAVGVVVLGAVTVWLATRLTRVRRDYEIALGTDRREDLFQAVRRHVEDVARLREDLGVVHDNTEMLRDLLRDSVSRVGVFRYDAFEDMGGALSFSAAMLDERGDGVVLSTINGRTEARTYAKAIRGGQSEHHLSEEEVAAIQQALSGDKGERTGTGGRRRRRAAS